ncbi:CAP domain-containing protein [Jeotgalibacillus marinus]|uniref:CAP domain-containing protein n=1 Tax=Jeotgalibacillus marinus TaxID=86667 RepID=A0ABV3Q3K5_9BACL
MKGKSLIISGAVAIALLVAPTTTQGATPDSKKEIQKQQDIEWMIKCLDENNLSLQGSKLNSEEILAQFKKGNIDLSTIKENKAQATPQKQEQPVEKPQVEKPESQDVAQPSKEQEATPNKSNEQEDASDVSSFEQQVVDLTNAERSKEGLAPLQLDVELSKVAKDKSKDMQQNQYFDHNSPTHGSPFDMMKEYGVSYKSAGENIAMGQGSPEEVVQAWMNSEGHRKNIMSSSYTHIGVGHIKEGNYWTQMFIEK